MANRNRTNPVQFYLSDDEQYILNTKFKASGMKSQRTQTHISADTKASSFYMAVQGVYLSRQG